MAVKIRLAQRGRKKHKLYDVVVANEKSPRDGRFIEKLGSYDPHTNPDTININVDRALYWVMTGALPTDRARKILSLSGVMYKKHLQVGVDKGAITQEQADEKYSAWTTQKEENVTGVVSKLQSAKEADLKKRFEAETKVKEAKAKAIVKKNTPEEVVAEAEAEAETQDSVAEIEVLLEETQAAAKEENIEVVSEALEVVAEALEVVAEAKEETPAVAEPATEEAPVAEEAPASEEKSAE